jgi:hypothetical protein
MYGWTAGVDARSAPAEVFALVVVVIGVLLVEVGWRLDTV